MENLYCKTQKGNSQEFRDNWDNTFRRNKNEHNSRRSIDEGGNSSNGNREVGQGKRLFKSVPTSKMRKGIRGKLYSL